MRIAVMIMSTLTEPSLRNVETMKKTFIKEAENLQNSQELKHSYDFYIYYSDPELKNEVDFLDGHDYYRVNKDIELENTYNISIAEEESVYLTYEKTYTAFIAIPDVYDWYVRINISTFLNIRLLDKVLDVLKSDTIYCNALNSYVNPECEYVNDLYPRGDFYLCSKKMRNGIIEHGLSLLHCDHALKNRIEIPHVDDCLVGIALINFMGKDYYKHYKLLKYNFIGSPTIKEQEFDKYTLASRVKTMTPEAKCSGYSWDDNDYRKYDVEKMKAINDIYKNMKLYPMVESDILVDKKSSRPAVYVQTAAGNVFTDFPKFLEYKRR